MAILTNNLSKAISEVLSGISDGVEDVGNVVANVTAKPPEKVVFEVDAITQLNFFERKKIVEVPEKRITTQVEEVTATDEFYLDGVFAEAVNYVDSTAFSVERTEAAGGYETRKYEDNALSFTLEVPGPKSS
jgi:hypothetical protein